MDPVRVLVHPSDSLASVEGRFRKAGVKSAAVVNAGKLVGVVSLTDIAEVTPEDWSTATVNSVMSADPISVAATETLDVALGHLSDRRVSWLPVIDSVDGCLVVGQLQTQAIVHAYRSQVSKGVRGMRGLVAETECHEPAGLTP
jgi:CBS domain-containing protein